MAVQRVTRHVGSRVQRSRRWTKVKEGITISYRLGYREREERRRNEGDTARNSTVHRTRASEDGEGERREQGNSSG